MKQYRRKKLDVISAEKRDEPFWVQTLEGTMHGKAGDYLVKGTHGEMYVIDAKIFKDNYELVENFISKPEFPSSECPPERGYNPDPPQVRTIREGEIVPKIEENE